MQLPRVLVGLLVTVWCICPPFSHHVSSGVGASSVDAGTSSLDTTDPRGLSGNVSLTPEDRSSNLETYCPAMCACNQTAEHSLSNVFCDGRNLTSVPIILTIEVQLLNLSANWIPSINNYSFGFKITNQSFRSLEYLRFLHLGYNRILDIHSRAFQGLFNLSHLYLQNNQITNLAPEIFIDLKNLQFLDLSQNNLSTIPSRLFQTTQGLQNLDISHNKLFVLDPGILEGLSILSYLDISGNPIESIDPPAFKSLHNLRELDLSNALLTRIDPVFFRMLKRLQYLDISNNSLETLPLACFQYLTNIREVNVKGNPIVCDCIFLSILNDITENHGSPLNKDTLHLPLCFAPPTHSGQVPWGIPMESQKCGSLNVSGLSQGVICGEMSHQTMNMNEGPTTSNPQKSPFGGPAAYDPLLGWYTAAVLGGMLVAFLLCVGLDRIKLAIINHIQHRKLRREHGKYVVVTECTVEAAPPQANAGAGQTNSEFVSDGEEPSPNRKLTNTSPSVQFSPVVKLDVVYDAESGYDGEGSKSRVTLHNLKPPDTPDDSHKSLKPCDPSGQNNMHSTNCKSQDSANSSCAGTSENYKTNGLSKSNSVSYGTSSQRDLPSQHSVEIPAGNKTGNQAKPHTSVRSPSQFWALWRQVRRDTKDAVVEIHPHCPIHNPEVAKRIQRMMKTKNKSLHSLLEEESFF